MRKLEQQLIKGIKLKDKSSFDTLFFTYYSTLLLIANDILDDIWVSEEVVQDVFVKIWNSGADISIETSLGAYLAMMVRNKSIDHLRSKKHQIKTVSLDNMEIQLKLHSLGADSSFEDELFTDPLEAKLKQIIDQLPPKCKQIFILNRFDGYSAKEISEMLQLSLNTVKTQITRALQKLKMTF